MQFSVAQSLHYAPSNPLAPSHVSQRTALKPGPSGKLTAAVLKSTESMPGRQRSSRSSRAASTGRERRSQLPPLRHAFIADDRRLYGSGATAKSDSTATTRVHSLTLQPFCHRCCREHRGAIGVTAADIAAFFKRADELVESLRQAEIEDVQVEFELARLTEVEGAGAGRSL